MDDPTAPSGSRCSTVFAQSRIGAIDSNSSTFGQIVGYAVSALGAKRTLASDRVGIAESCLWLIAARLRETSIDAFRKFPKSPAVRKDGRLAQLVEHLVYTERVGSSSLSAPTIPEHL